MARQDNHLSTGDYHEEGPTTQAHRRKLGEKCDGQTRPNGPDAPSTNLVRNAPKSY